MSRYSELEMMLITVALALGEELRKKVVFVGGCTTGLFVTDHVTRESIRFTEDVDLIVDVMGFTEWDQLQRELFKREFTVNPEDDVLCRMRLGELKVDFMPDDESVLGFGNRWYSDAIETAQIETLSNETKIQLIAPEYFIATKLEAYLGRGEGDLLSSRDIEDILNVIDGRPHLINEIQARENKFKSYIASTFEKIMEHPDFPYAVLSTARGEEDRAEVIQKRLKRITNLQEKHTEK